MFLTILTPTYNRSDTLKRLYRSLEKQSDKSFVWQIIDDGSSDNTEEEVNKMLEKSSFKIEYYLKENGGKHSAINFGINKIDTPLVFIVDSDDYLVENAVHIIANSWKKYKSNEEIGSFWYLIKDSKNQIIGDKFPKDDFISSYQDVMINRETKGDKKAVYLTKTRKEFPFPIFKDEKFIGESTVHMPISKKYKSVFINEAIYVAEYLKGGLTDSGVFLRITNPLGGMANSKMFFSKDINTKIYTKKKILFVTYGFFAKKRIKEILRESGELSKTLMFVPLSYALYLYWKKYLK